METEIKTCADCQEEFEFTSGEKKFLQGLFDDGKIKEVTAPKRCPSCRQKRKAQRTQEGY